VSDVEKNAQETDKSPRRVPEKIAIAVLSAAIGGAATVGVGAFGFLSKDRELDIEMVGIALQILSGEVEDGDNSEWARRYALRTLSKYSDVEIPSDEFEQWAKHGVVPQGDFLLQDSGVQIQERVVRSSDSTIFVITDASTETTTLRLYPSFASASAALINNFEDSLLPDVLTLISNVISTSNDAVQVTVVGHTDSIPLSGRGQFKTNEELSEARAASVASYLRTSLQMDVVALGRGDQNPIADNATREGRTLNRRIEILISPRA